MKPKIEILLLGPPAIIKNDAVQNVAEEQARTVLFYLASQGGMTPVGQIASVFREKIHTNSALFDLDTLQAALQAQLGETGLVVKRENAVGLNFDRVRVDQASFQEAVDRAGSTPWQTPAHLPLPEDSLHWLEKAADCWREPYFMAGASLPPAPGLQRWFRRRKAALEGLLMRVQSRLAWHDFAQGEWERCLRRAKIALLHDEFNEGLHHLVLRVLLQQERIPEARAYFENVRERMREKLDTTPGAQLMELYGRLQIRTAESLSQPIRPSWPLRSRYKAPFVDRRRELRLLQEAWEKGGAFALLGDSGLGKTHLLQESIKRIQTPYRLLLAICHPAENSLTLQPFIELLRHHIETRELLALPATWAAQLSLLLPEILDLRPEIRRPEPEAAAGAGMDASRTVLMEAIRQILLLAAREKPVLFCLEDAQWADEATLATITYLLARPPFDRRSLLMITARPGEKNIELERLLTAIQETAWGRVYHLPALGPDEVSELAALILGYTPHRQVVEHLTDETAGNPLFLIETLHAYQDQNPGRMLTDSAALPLTENLYTLIRNRLNHLDLPERKFLEIAALLGQEFHPEIAAQVGKFSTAETVEVLESLSAQGLIEPLSRSSEDPYHRFHHSKFREVLMDELHPSRRRLLHGAIAKALQEKHGFHSSDQAAVLARHYECGGEPVLAFHCWIQAAQRARQLFSPKDAIAHFRRAESLIKHASELEDRQIFVLFARWCELAFELEDISALEYLSQALLDQGQARNSALLTGAGLNVRSDIWMIRNRFHEALETVQQALPYMEASGFLYEQIETYIRLGTYRYMINQVDGAIEAFEDALALSTEADDELITRARGNAHYHYAVASILKARPESGLRHALRSLEDFRVVGNLHGQVTAYSAMSLAYYYLGEFEESLQAAHTGLELARRIESRRMIGYLSAYRGMTALILGNLNAAMQDFHTAVEIGAGSNHDEIAGGSYSLIADAYLLLEDHSNALAYYRCGLETLRGGFMYPDCQIRLGYTLFLNGRCAEGREQVERALAVSNESGMELMSLKARMALARLAAREGRLEEAASQAQQLDKELRQRRLEVLRTGNTILMARINLQQGKTNEAIYQLQKAARQDGARNNPWSQLSIQTLMLAAEVINGKPYEVYLLRAQSLLDEIGRAPHPDLQESLENFQKRTRAFLQAPEKLINQAA